MKPFGLTLVFVSFALCGFIVSRAKLQTIKYITSLVALISEVKQGILYYRRELPDIFARFDDRFLLDTGFLRMLRERGLLTALEKTSSIIRIPDSEYRLLVDFAYKLGKSDTETEKELCEKTQKVLEALLDKMKADYPKQRKIALSLGILAGSLFVILLI